MAVWEMDPETSWLYVGFCMDVLFLWFLLPHGSCLIYSCLRINHTVSQMKDPGQVEVNHLPSPLPTTLNVWSWELESSGNSWAEEHGCPIPAKGLLLQPSNVPQAWREAIFVHVLEG